MVIAIHILVNLWLVLMMRTSMPLFEAIRVAPCTESFRDPFHQRDLPPPPALGLERPEASEGLFDCRDISTTETGDLLVRVRLSSGRAKNYDLRI